MDSFAFIIHPLNPKADVARKYPRLAQILPVSMIHFLSRFWPPLVLSHVTGLRSATTGREIEGWLLACPLTARQMLRLPPRVVYRKILQTARLAQKLGTRILGLGAYTSVVGDGGATIAQRSEIPVTTGDSYTVALVARALLTGGRRIGIEPEEATVAVVGATGAIGSACARLLASRVRRLILVGRRESRLQEVARLIDQADGPASMLSTRVETIREADLVVSATSAAHPVIYPEHLKPGAVVCDVALPPDVSPRVAQERDDVLVLDGGLARVPGEVDFNFDYGLSAGMTFGCMAEVMVLALEGRFEDFTVGKDLSVGRVLEIERIADRQGFSLAEFRSFNQPLTDEQIEAIRCRVGRGVGGCSGLASEVTQ